MLIVLYLDTPQRSASLYFGTLNKQKTFNALLLAESLPTSTRLLSTNDDFFSPHSNTSLKLSRRRTVVAYTMVNVA
jgi:hypothetical protein